MTSLLSKPDAERLMVCHNRAVKAAMRWEAATPGTRTKERRFGEYGRAEAAFSAELIGLSRPRATQPSN